MSALEDTSRIPARFRWPVVRLCFRNRFAEAHHPMTASRHDLRPNRLIQAAWCALTWLALASATRMAEAGCGDYLGLGHAASHLVSDAWTPLWASLDRDSKLPDDAPHCQGAACRPAAPTPNVPTRALPYRVFEGTLTTMLAWTPSERVAWRWDSARATPQRHVTRLFRPPRAV